MHGNQYRAAPPANHEYDRDRERLRVLREPARDRDDDDDERRRPEPLFFPPPVSLFTVAQARRAASLLDTPRFSYPSSMCLACRFCLLE